MVPPAWECVELTVGSGGTGTCVVCTGTMLSVALLPPQQSSDSGVPAPQSVIALSTVCAMEGCTEMDFASVSRAGLESAAKSPWVRAANP